MEERDRRD